MAATSRAAAKGHNYEQADDFWELLEHGREAHAIKLGVMDVEELVDLPEVSGRLRRADNLSEVCCASM